MKTVIYPGSFDPVTYGHLDIMRRALALFPKVIVAVAKNSAKTPLFDPIERAGLITRSIKEAALEHKRLRVEIFDDLLVDYLSRTKAKVIIRGLRFISDFEYEFQMALMNRRLMKDIDTLYLMPEERFIYLSSSIVKEIARYGRDTRKFVPDCVANALASKHAP
ncbi:MAG: pantetheine-phosphate adenylyltransferase [Elusimicrobiota bacterium]